MRTNQRIRSLTAAASAALVLATNLALAADYQSTVLADSPAGYWRLGELPVTFADPYVATNLGSLGTAANGSFVGGLIREAPGALAGSTDTACQFNTAESSRITISGAANFNFTGNGSAMPFTLEVWAKPTATLSGTQRLLANGPSGGYGFSFFGTSQLRVTAFGVADVTSDSAPVAFQPNQWYHLALVRSNGFVFFYTNGVRFGAPKSLANINTTVNALTMGRTPGGSETFTGVLDEAAVFTNVLTAAQLGAHYSAGINNEAGYSGVILADNPIGYWRLNEPKKPQESSSVIANSGSVGAAGDGSVLGSLNSVVGGAISPLVGDANTAMGYNGTDGKITVPYNAGLNPASFTVECWARVDAWANTYQAPFTSRNSTTASGNRGYIFYAAPLTVTGQFTNAPRWEFWSGNGSAFQSSAGPTTNVALGQWTHLVGTFDAATGSKLFYVDGQLVGGAINASVVPNNAGFLRIGAGATESVFGNYFVNGAVDEVAVYPSALSPQRIQTHYQVARGNNPTVSAAPGTLVNPVNQTNWAPYLVNVSCVVTGSLPMQLQWYHVLADGTATNAVPGGTNLVLTLNPTAASDSGNYYLAATNSLGGTETAWAWIEITPPTPPTITLDLAPSVPVYVGGTAGLEVAAAGTPPIYYLLQSNSTTIAVSTNMFLKIPKVQTAYGTVDYQIVVTNLFGTVQSATTRLTVLTAPVSTYAAVTTNLNPAGYWRLGEDVGTTAYDYWSGRNADCVGGFLNFPTGALVDDDDGCVQLNGAGNYVRVRDASAFNYFGTTNRFTLSAWIKADSWPATGARVFSTRWLVGNTGGYGFGIWNGNSYRFTAFGVTDIAQGLPTLALGQWYHVAAVCSNLTVYFYLNGAYQGTGNAAIGATGIKTSPYPLQLGGSPNFSAAADEEPFLGQIDEAAAFSRVLTTTEIKALYDARYGSLIAPTFVKEPTPVQLYPGGTARFSAEVTGSAPLSYQWKTNGVAITGATNTDLIISSVTAGMNVTLTVTNRAGSLTSANAALTVLAAPAGYASAVLQDNPMAFWRLSEPFSSTIVFDSWGSHNGTPIGNVTFGAAGAISGDANTCATFDGLSPTRVEAPYATELNSSVFTVECWARVTGGAGTYRAAVSSRNQVQGSSMGGYIIYATAGNVWSFWTGTGTGWEALNGPAVVLNEWTHIVATFDGTEKRFYVNGALVASTTATAIVNPLRPIRIGGGQNEADPGDYFFVGDIDDVAVYNKVLTADRVEYHNGLGMYGENTAPFVIRQPVDQTVQVGSPAALTARAGGSPILRLQWLKDGAPIPDATNATLNLAATTYSDTGTYFVRVTNLKGSADSTAAKLTVMPPPAFAFATNDLVLHLKFDNNLQDASGRGNHGTAVGTPSFVAGKVGANALHYNTDTASGTYNYVTLGTPADLLFSSNVNFSVAYWARFTGTPGDLPFLCNAVNSYGNFGFTFAPSYTAGGWSWSLGNATSSVGVNGPANSINDGNWHHLVHTFDRAGAVATAVTYLDGVQVDSRSVAAAGDIDSGAAVNIGQDPTGAYAETGAADIDDLGVWRRVLTSYEAQSIYTVGQQSGASFDVTAPIQLLVQRKANDVELVWQAGTLQQADSVNGTYTPVPGATAPYYKVPAAAPIKFYRVKP